METEIKIEETVTVTLTMRRAEATALSMALDGVVSSLWSRGIPGAVGSRPFEPESDCFIAISNVDNGFSLFLDLTRRIQEHLGSEDEVDEDDPAWTLKGWIDHVKSLIGKKKCLTGKRKSIRKGGGR